MTSAPPCPTHVVFDLGGVLIDWNPRYLYRKLFAGDDVAMETFLATVCTPEWNHAQDAGRPFAEAVALLQRSHPHQSELIAAFYARWEEMLGGVVPGVPELLDELAAAKVGLYALTNWSAETFHHAEARFPFLRRFADIVVSGRIGLAKPDPAIYRHLLRRHALSAGRCVFIDDRPENTAAAAGVGMGSLLFADAPQLRRSLVDLGLTALARAPRHA